MRRCNLCTLFAVLLAVVSSSSVAGTSFTFQDGSTTQGNYLNSPVLGQTDQPIGRVRINAPGCCANVQQFTITLSGTHTGLSNFKMWNSTDQSFGGDTQYGSTVPTDPGAGSLQFTQVLTLGSTPGDTYFFLTADVDANATGSVLPLVTGLSCNTSVFNYAGNGYDRMANATEPVPVTVSSIKVE